MRLTKVLCITPHSSKYTDVPKKLQYENRGHMYIMTPDIYSLFNSLLNHCWKAMQTDFMVHKKIPKFNEMIKNYQQQSKLFKLFLTIFEEVDRTENKEVIENIWKRLVKHSCSKLIWTGIDQLGLNQCGMWLRDQFKYEHFKNIQSKQKK